MKKNYWWIIGLYLVVGQLLPSIVATVQINEGLEAIQNLWVPAQVICAVLTIAGTIFLLRDEIKENLRLHPTILKGKEILWIFAGLFLIYFANAFAMSIEHLLFNTPLNSDNTEEITNIFKSHPSMLFVVVVFAPIMEEIIFRKIIFGTLNKRFHFAIAVLISSLIFGLVHMELEHLLTYFSIGLILAFLYKKTGRIIVPIGAHALLNGLAMLANTLID